MEFFGQQSPKSAPKSSVNNSSSPQSDADESWNSNAPLADRMRPQEFDEFHGQEKAVGPESFLRRLLEADSLPSLILWGPPGCGKTTLARLIALRSAMDWQSLSAVTAGIKDARAIIQAAKDRLATTGRKMILFVDEIHRFNKAQQDAFLPHVEAGTIVLFGATTENPSFSVIAPLLSRCRVITLQALDADAVRRILQAALADKERGLGKIEAEVGADTLAAIANVCDGDARRALNLLEQCVGAAKPDEGGVRRVDEALLAEVSARTHLLYDQRGEEHFNLISALHKSLRSSDPQGALYWLARMLQSGEEPIYIGRRLVRFATEDVGLADPQALPQALAGVQSYQMLGSPEGELALVQVVIYLATAPKSNALYKSWATVSGEIKKTGSLPVPLHLRNAPTGLMKAEGYGKGYQYDHESEGGFSGQETLPEGLNEKKFYEPGAFGFERDIQKRIEWWESKRAERTAPPEADAE